MLRISLAAVLGVLLMATACHASADTSSRSYVTAVTTCYFNTGRPFNAGFGPSQVIVTVTDGTGADSFWVLFQAGTGPREAMTVQQLLDAMANHWLVSGFSLSIPTDQSGTPFTPPYSLCGFSNVMPFDSVTVSAK